MLFVRKFCFVLMGMCQQICKKFCPRLKVWLLAVV